MVMKAALLMKSWSCPNVFQKRCMISVLGNFCIQLHKHGNKCNGQWSREPYQTPVSEYDIELRQNYIFNYYTLRDGFQVNPKPYTYEASTDIFNKILNYWQFQSCRYLNTNMLFKIQSVYVFYLGLIIPKQYTCKFVMMEKCQKVLILYI